MVILYCVEIAASSSASLSDLDCWLELVVDLAHALLELLDLLLLQQSHLILLGFETILDTGEPLQLSDLVRVVVENGAERLLLDLKGRLTLHLEGVDGRRLVESRIGLF